MSASPKVAQIYLLESKSTKPSTFPRAASCSHHPMLPAPSTIMCRRGSHTLDTQNSILADTLNAGWFSSKCIVTKCYVVNADIPTAPALRCGEGCRVSQLVLKSFESTIFISALHRLSLLQTHPAAFLLITVFHGL